VGGHGSGAGVGEQVNEHVVGFEQEQVVMGGAQQLGALVVRNGSIMVLLAMWGLFRHRQTIIRLSAND
jgi:predicted RNA-binding protein